MGTLLKRALDQAAVWHRAQRRKYPNADVPYISHLAGVAVLLARYGFDDEVVAAGALHDAMEDQGVTFDELLQHFGERVATLVLHVTEQDRSLPWEDRKRLYLDAFPGKPWEAQAITLADKIDNFQSIIVCSREHGDPWSMFKRGRDVQVARFEELRAMSRALPPHPLLDEYGAVLDELLSLG
ncbi:HD domain-containing protein [Sorangium sp. So ce118]